MDGELKYIHVVWIPAIPAGMTGFEALVYKDERRTVGTIYKENARAEFAAKLDKYQ